MNIKQPTQEELAQAIYRYAADELQAGHAAHEVQNKLEQKGVSPLAAKTVLQNLDKNQAESDRAAAWQDMFTGGLFCLAGFAVTVGTYAAASPGETFIVA